MKNFKNFLQERIEIPKEIIKKWKDLLAYDKAMKTKFSYFDVSFKSKQFTRGHKGQNTKLMNNLVKTIKMYKLDTDETIEKLSKIFPPKHF